jgi:hypothetical protein
MPTAGFEPRIPTNEQPQTQALDLAATGIGIATLHYKNIRGMCTMSVVRQFFRGTKAYLGVRLPRFDVSSSHTHTHTHGRHTRTRTHTHASTHARARAHTHTRYDSSGRVISSSQRPLLTRRTTTTGEEHPWPRWDSKMQPSNQASADLRLRAHSHRDRRLTN